MDLNNVVLTVVIVATGLSAGIYLAFSVLVMPTVRSAPAAQAVETMQEINKRALEPIFMMVFFGAALGSIAVLAIGWSTSLTVPALVGAVLSLLAFVVTAVMNQPLNRQLDDLEPDTVQHTSDLAALLTRWTYANHLRAGMATLGFLAYTLAE